MSRGLGSMQNWLVLYLGAKPESIGRLHKKFMMQFDRTGAGLLIARTEFPDRGGKDRARSLRHSMTRALRQMEKLGKVKRNEDGLWFSPQSAEAEAEHKEDIKQERRKTAYHEAGHAVIGLASGLPVGIAVARDHDRRGGGYVSDGAQTTGSLGWTYKYNRRGKRQFVTDIDETKLDAFGNPVRERVWTDQERHAEVVMCIAGGMAQATFLGAIEGWRECASSADIAIARRHMGKLGGKAKSWEQYVEDTAALVNKYWKMIEAVAARLTQVEFLDGRQIDNICQRVVRRQHLNKKKTLAP
jgi:hypothetical protein